MQIAIVDDRAEDREELSVCLENYMKKHQLDYTLTEFEDGENFCMSIRGYSRDVPLLWISDQAEFEPQSRRLQVDTFLVKPVTEYQLREAVSRLLQKTTRRNEQREEDE